MKIYNNAAELIGNTPLVRFEAYSKAADTQGNILAKLEYLNPAGSVKDRTALGMINDAENKQKLRHH